MRLEADDTIGDLPFAGDVSDDCFGQPDHKGPQPAVLAYQAIHGSGQSCLPIGFIETIRPFMLRNSFLHCVSFGLTQASLLLLSKIVAVNLVNYRVRRMTTT